MSDDVHSAHIYENGESIFAVTIEVAGIEIPGDEPVAAGGGGTGPNPYDMLVSALGECTAMTVRWYAKQQNWPVDKVEVNITHRKEKVEGRPRPADVFEKHVIVHGDLLTAEQRAKLLDVAKKCPVQRTLEGDPIIKTTM